MRTLNQNSDRPLARPASIHIRATCEFRAVTPLFLVLLVLTGAGVASAQTFSVRNPKHLKFPEAEATRIYRSAGDAIQQEFQQSDPVRPQFTLVLGAERNQVDVNTNELRLVKWDQNLFAKGVVLFSFEQLMPEQRSMRLTERVLSQANATVSSEEARTSVYAPTAPTLWRPNPIDALQSQPHPVLQPR